MPQSYKGLSIPAYADAADGPKAFKDFTDSGVIPRFANAGARTTAITTPTTGMLVYMIDTADYQVWDGAAWVVPYLKTSGGTMAGQLNMSGAKIINLGTPVDPGDAINKTYADGLASVGHTHATGAHVHSGTEITTGTVAAAQIGVLDTSKITTGVFVDARIPSLAAAKITSGTFDPARIPSLDASKITTGSLVAARIATGTSSSTVALGNHEHARLAPHTGGQSVITVSTGAPSGGANGDIHLRV